jgi:hypothetical protein
MTDRTFGADVLASLALCGGLIFCVCVSMISLSRLFVAEMAKSDRVGWRQ